MKKIRSYTRDRRALKDQITRRAQEVEALNQIAAVTSQSSDLGEIINLALQKALRLIGVNQGGIYLLEDRAGVLRIAAQYGLTPILIKQIDCLKVGEGFSGQVAQTGRPLVVNDVSSDPRLTRIFVVEAGIRSVAVVPIRSKGSILGTLFALTGGVRDFQPREVELLNSIGSQIGVAIENARLLADTKSRLAQLSALQETSRAVVSTLDLNELLQLIIQQAATLLQAEGGILNLVDWETGEDEVVACTGEAVGTLGIKMPVDRTLSGWVSLHNLPQISNDVRNDPRAYRHGGPDVFQKQITNAAVAPLRNKDRVIGTLVVVDKLGGAADFEHADLELLSGFANQAAAALENARLYAAERRRADQFRVIAEIGRRLTLILDLDELLKQVVTVIQESFGYYHVAIGLVEGDEVIYKYGAGMLWGQPNFHLVPSRLKVGREGVSGWVAGSGIPLNVPDVSKEPRYIHIEGSAGRSELIVPILVKDKVIGTLDALSDRLNAFDELDLMVMQSLAFQVGAAIDNARLYQKSQQTAVMEERSRLARELHDAVTQTLFSASLIAEAVPPVWEKDPQQGRELLQELRGLSRGALAEMRTLLLELRPAALVETPLEDLLVQLGEAASGREGIPVAVNITGECNLPPAVHITFYRIAQEALNNVVKHARASQVDIHLSYPAAGQDHDRKTGRQSVRLSICDNGRGFEMTQSPHNHMGLGIMQERALAIGATLQVVSRVGTGTQVIVLWEQGSTQEAI